MGCGNTNWEYTHHYLKLPSQLLKWALVEERKVGAPWEILEYLER
jgi:hypothetical protein